MLVVYDDPSDTTLPYLEKYAASDVARAAGAQHPRRRARPAPSGRGSNRRTRRSPSSRWPTAATTPSRSTTSANLVDRGVVIAAASRYMSGGQQIGGPQLKSLLSRLAGLSLYWLGARRHP